MSRDLYPYTVRAYLEIAWFIAIAKLGRVLRLPAHVHNEWDDQAAMRRFRAALAFSPVGLTGPPSAEVERQYRDPEMWGEAVATPIKPKRLEHVFSVRFDRDQAEQLFAAARAAGITVSEYLRRGVQVAAELAETDTTEQGAVGAIGYGCQHMSITAGGATLSDVEGWCGCEMQPMYATR